MITRAQTDIMGADPRNAELPPAGRELPPYEPWAKPVMILAGVARGGPWLWLAGRCGWFLGYEAQFDPDALAAAARRHRDECGECGGAS